MSKKWLVVIILLIVFVISFCIFLFYGSKNSTITGAKNIGENKQNIEIHIGDEQLNGGNDEIDEGNDESSINSDSHNCGEGTTWVCVPYHCSDRRESNCGSYCLCKPNDMEMF